MCAPATSLSGNQLTRDATRQLVQILRRPGSFDALTSMTLGDIRLPVQQLLGYSTATAVMVSPDSETDRRRIHHADVMFTTDAMLDNPTVTDLRCGHAATRTKCPWKAMRLGASSV